MLCRESGDAISAAHGSGAVSRPSGSLQEGRLTGLILIASYQV
jgi:hypothetical protein